MKRQEVEKVGIQEEMERRRWFPYDAMGDFSFLLKDKGKEVKTSEAKDKKCSCSNRGK